MGECQSLLLDDLDEKSLIKILIEPKNSLIKQYKRLFEFEDVELEFKDEAISEIAKKAISKNWCERFKIDIRKYSFKNYVRITRYGKCH